MPIFSYAYLTLSYKKDNYKQQLLELFLNFLICITLNDKNNYKYLTFTGDMSLQLFSFKHILFYFKHFVSILWNDLLYYSLIIKLSFLFQVRQETSSFSGQINSFKNRVFWYSGHCLMGFWIMLSIRYYSSKWQFNLYADRRICEFIRYSGRHMIGSRMIVSIVNIIKLIQNEKSQLTLSYLT